MDSRDLLTIGEVAHRSGLAASALRYYESLGLIRSHRTSGNQRRYTRSVLRRLAVVHAAQQVGLSLEEVCRAFAAFDPEHAPTKREWVALSDGGGRPSTRGSKNSSRCVTGCRCASGAAA